jgi:prepilin-type N-terminal cleavage/methylation domain-containing protein
MPVSRADGEMDVIRRSIEAFSESAALPHRLFNETIVQTKLTRHNAGAMRQRTVGRLCQTPGCPSSAFHRNALQQRRDKCAFTLIELLVVIAIIAVLIGLLFPAFRAVQNQARKTQAKNDLTQIANAVSAYYTEYGKYPVDVPSGNIRDAYFGSGTAPATAVNYGSNDWLFDVLRSNTSSTRNSANACPGTNLVTCLNPRRIVFISPPNVKDTTNPRGGIGTNGQYYDPWGTPYNVAIDENYNSIVCAPAYSDLVATYSIPNPADGSGDVGVRTGAISWSFGADLTLGTSSPPSSNYKDSDDVISWQ